MRTDVKQMYELVKVHVPAPRPKTKVDADTAMKLLALKDQLSFARNREREELFHHERFERSCK